MSGTPTWSGLMDRLTAFADAHYSTRNYAETIALAKFTAIEALTVGDYGPTGNPAYTNSHRAFLSSALGSETILAGMIPLYLDSGLVTGSPANVGDIARLGRDFFEYMRTHATLNRIKSRDPAYGVPAPGANTGSGPDPTRLTVDENGLTMEAFTAEDKTLICRQDQTTGSRRGAELFEVHGEAPSQDTLRSLELGSGWISEIRVQHAGAGAGGSLLVNSSFDELIVTGAGAATVPGWNVPANDGNISQTSAIFTAPPGIADVDSYSLRLAGDVKIQQTIEDAGFTADVATPYILSMRYKTEGGADGALSIRMGTTKVTVADLTIPTGSVWNDLIVVADATLWPANFYEDRMMIEVELLGRTVGTVDIDHVVFTRMDLVDGTYIHQRGGVIPFQLDDEFLWTDVANATAKIQEMFLAAGLGYMPSSVTPNIIDPV